MADVGPDVPIKRKVGRPKKVIENYEEVHEKQREYMRNYMKEYMIKKKDDVAFMENHRMKMREYQNGRAINDPEYRNNKLVYAKNYYKKLKDAFKNNQIADES
jgi:hypothetical protein